MSSASIAVFMIGQPPSIAGRRALPAKASIIRVEPVDGVGGAVLRAGEALGDAAHRVVVRLERELFLGAEVVVDPALFEAGGADEVAQRGADEALAVEHRRGELDDALAGALALGGGRTDHCGLLRLLAKKTDRSV